MYRNIRTWASHLLISIIMVCIFSNLNLTMKNGQLVSNLLMYDSLTILKSRNINLSVPMICWNDEMTIESNISQSILKICEFSNMSWERRKWNKRLRKSIVVHLTKKNIYSSTKWMVGNIYNATTKLLSKRVNF